jgi:hypothetical protein
VIDVTVAEKNVGLNAGYRLCERISEESQAAAGIEDDQAIAAAHLNARRVAAVPRGPVSRAGSAATHSPEANQDVGQ